MKKYKNAFLKALGANIRRIRNSKGITQEQLAELSDIERTYYVRIERGERNITIYRLYCIAQALKVDLQELFNFE